MNVPSSTPASKGMNMVAAYRAERLSQRPMLRSSLQGSHSALRMARVGSHQGVEPDNQPPLEVATVEPAPAAAPHPKEPGSVFANLVSTSVATETDEAAFAEAKGASPAISSDHETDNTAAPQLGATSEASTSSTDAASTAQQAPEPEPAPVAAAPVAETPVAEIPVAEIPVAPAPVAEAPVAEAPVSAAPVSPAPVAPSVYDPPLAQIGFGPGMLIRLSQLGMHTTADLARADADQLRSELGEISRLVDVEAWILNARQTVGAAST